MAFMRRVVSFLLVIEDAAVAAGAVVIVAISQQIVIKLWRNLHVEYLADWLLLAHLPASSRRSVLRDSSIVDLLILGGIADRLPVAGLKPIAPLSRSVSLLLPPHQMV